MSKRDAVRFFGAAVRHPRSVGAVAPSSRHLAAAMVRGLVLVRGRAVVEFGPGTGPFTRALAGVMPDRADYLGIERDAQLVGLLRSRLGDMAVVQGSAEDAERLVAEAGHASVQAVICGLPFASLPAGVQDRVVDAVDRLVGPGAEFRTFQYVHAMTLPAARRFRRAMSARLGRCEISRPVMRNLPPAVVLRWTRVNSGG